MEKITLGERVKKYIANAGWKLFLWGNSMTFEQYRLMIYEQEKAYRENLDKSKRKRAGTTMKRFIEIEILNVPTEGMYYQDRTDACIFRFSVKDGYYPGQKWTPERDQVLNYIKAYDGRSLKDIGEEKGWHETYIKSLEQLNENEWKVVIVEPSTE